MPGVLGGFAKLTRLSLMDALRQHPAVSLIRFVIWSIVENFRVKLGVTVRDFVCLTIAVLDRELPFSYHFIGRSFRAGSNSVSLVLFRTSNSQAAIDAVVLLILLV